MLQKFIWQDLKCTMDAHEWEEAGGEYDDLPVKMIFGTKEEDVSLSVMSFEDLDEEEVCDLLRDFIGNWETMQAKVLRAVYEAFEEFLDENGENSELDINDPAEMEEYLTLTTMIVMNRPICGLCVGLGFGEKWDVHFDDYEDVGVLISGGEVVAVGSSEVIM